MASYLTVSGNQRKDDWTKVGPGKLRQIRIGETGTTVKVIPISGFGAE